MDENIEIGSFAKNSREEVRGYLTTYKDCRLAHIRIFVENADGAEVPTKRGIAIRVEQFEELKALVDALAGAVQAERSRRIRAAPGFVIDRARRRPN